MHIHGPIVCIVYAGQRKGASNGVTVSCFLAISNEREGTNADSDSVFCSAVNIRVSKPKCEQDPSSTEVEGNFPVTKVPSSLLGKGGTLDHLLLQLPRRSWPLPSFRPGRMRSPRCCLQER